MATIFNNIKSNGTAPYAYYTVWATVNTRNENNVVLDVYMNARLAKDKSSLGQGSTMGLDVYFNFANTGQTAAWRIKATNVSWSGTKNHRIPSSGTRQYTVNVSPSATSISTRIKVNRTGKAANTTDTGKGCWVAWRDGSALAIDAWKYNVSYNANGGNSTPAGGNYACGSSITLASAISRNESTSTGTITITYNANNGTGAPQNSTGTYTDATPYTFNGWHVGSESGTSYGAGASYTIPQGNTTFYAGWNAGATYRKSNPSITLSTVQPTRTGYTFLGWSTDSGATAASYSGGSAYTFSNNTTLYAVWRINTYTNRINHWTWGYLHEEGDNGSKNALYLGSTTFDQTYNSNYTMDASRKMTIPNGFYLDNTFRTSSISGSWENYNMGISVTQKAAVMLYEYDYSPYNYTITYELNNGENNPNNPESYTVLYGVTLNEPTKEGSIFVGWFINGVEVTGINPGANASFSSIEDLYNQCAQRTIGNIIVEARWIEADTKIKIKINKQWISGKVWVKQSGAWIKAKKIYVKQNSEWKAAK